MTQGTVTREVSRRSEPERKTTSPLERSSAMESFRVSIDNMGWEKDFSEV